VILLLELRARLGGVKIIWTVDAQKAREFRETYTPKQTNYGYTPTKKDKAKDTDKQTIFSAVVKR